LLLGTEEGPALAHIFSAVDLAHPTDVALSDDGTLLYVSDEGEEGVAHFTLDFGTAIPVPVADGLAGAGEPGQRLAEVLPLQESSLATVATFLTVPEVVAASAGGPDGEGSVVETSAVRVVAGSDVPVPAGEPAPGEGPEPAGGVEEASPAEAEAAVPALSPEA